MEDFLNAFEGDPRLSFRKNEAVIGIPLPNLLTEVGFLSSKGLLPIPYNNGEADILDIVAAEVHRLLTSGGLYLNGIQLTTNDTVSDGNLLDGRVVIFRAGKDRHKIIMLGEP